jgi:hypothetical protein
MPLETMAGAGRISSCDAGVTRGSVDFRFLVVDLRTWAMADSCALGGFLLAEKGRTSASASFSKTKGRPRAAEVETTAEDIRFLGRFQGTPGLSRGGSFAFYSPF